MGQKLFVGRKKLLWDEKNFCGTKKKNDNKDPHLSKKEFVTKTFYHKVRHPLRNQAMPRLPPNMPKEKKREEGTQKHSQSVVQLTETAERQKIERLDHALQSLKDCKKNFVKSKGQTITHMKANSPEEDYATVLEFNRYIGETRKRMKNRQKIMREYDEMQSVLFPVVCPI